MPMVLHALVLTASKKGAICSCKGYHHNLRKSGGSERAAACHASQLSGGCRSHCCLGICTPQFTPLGLCNISTTSRLAYPRSAPGQDLPLKEALRAGANLSNFSFFPTRLLATRSRVGLILSGSSSSSRSSPRSPSKSGGLTQGHLTFLQRLV